MIREVSAQKHKIGVFDTAVDVGNPKLKGSSMYDASKQEYRLKGAGYNIWFNRDEFHYLASRIQGDFLVTADFEFVSPTGKDPHRKLGWMVRETLQEDAVHLTATIHGGDGLTVAQWRMMRGAYMRDPQDELFFPKRKARTIQLERRGKSYTMRIANFGEPLQSYGSVTMDNIGNNPYVGLFVGSHHVDDLVEARIWNVRVDRLFPSTQNFGSTDTMVSRLETIDISNGNRKIVYESTIKFEAPNFMPGGKSLLINSKGSLYTVPMEGGEATKLNTGFADRNNNDHVISFDGKMIGISHHRPGMFGGGSTIYVVPIGGGTPKLVTEKTPSYLHGWSGNNKEVYYVARRDTSRNSSYHIFKASIDNGSETQITNFNFGHVDGPEGSPDGQYIYYNGSQTGTMQLYRMRSDGTAIEQLTYDQYNNWFPHVSPDGKWIAYISFPDDIDPSSHPAFKLVSLKIMPVSGGAPRTIAYLYGGQGTINTPSWSPDSKQIAFVSYGGRIK